MKTRSPIKDSPLRLPGQSVEEERERLLDSSIQQPALLALMFVVLAGLEWFRYLTNQKLNPIIYSMAALLTVCYAAFRVWRALPQLRRLRQARDGERAVGQFLERLREQGYQVFHDVVGSNFNVDHVLVGPAGVFTFETKTWSKPVSGRPEILFDGERIKIGEFSPERDPLIQAKAQASWVRSILLESAGKQAPVRPVILFPGWFISATSGAHRDVWVLEPKGLPIFLGNEPNRLSSDDVKLFAFHLSRMIRASQER